MRVLRTSSRVGLLCPTLYFVCSLPHIVSRCLVPAYVVFCVLHPSEAEVAAAKEEYSRKKNSRIFQPPTNRGRGRGKSRGRGRGRGRGKGRGSSRSAGRGGALRRSTRGGKGLDGDGGGGEGGEGTSGERGEALDGDDSEGEDGDEGGGAVSNDARRGHGGGGGGNVSDMDMDVDDDDDEDDEDDDDGDGDDDVGESDQRDLGGSRAGGLPLQSTPGGQGDAATQELERRSPLGENEGPANPRPEGGGDGGTQTVSAPPASGAAGQAEQPKGKGKGKAFGVTDMDVEEDGAGEGMEGAAGEGRGGVWGDQNARTFVNVNVCVIFLVYTATAMVEGKNPRRCVRARPTAHDRPQRGSTKRDRATPWGQGHAAIGYDSGAPIFSRGVHTILTKEWYNFTQKPTLRRRINLTKKHKMVLFATMSG